jgi:hypothetical protein
VVYIILPLIAAGVLCIVFSKECKEGIDAIFKAAYQWVSREKPDPTKTFLAVVLAVGIFFVMRGNYELLLNNLRFVLPFKDTSHIVLAMLVLTGMIGIALHALQGMPKIIAFALTLAAGGMFAWVGYLQTEQTLAMNGMQGNQAVVAALQFGLLILMEVLAFYAFLFLGKAALGYIWLVFLLPLIPFYLIAHLSEAAKSFPLRRIEWKAEQFVKKSILFLKHAKMRAKVAREVEKDEPRKTRQEVMMRYYETIRKSVQIHIDAVRSAHWVHTFWLNFWMFWVNMFKGRGQARQVSDKISKSMLDSFDDIIKKVREKISETGDFDGSERKNNGKYNGTTKKKKRTIKEIGTITKALFIAIFISATAVVAEERFLIAFIDVTGSYPFTHDACRHAANAIIPHIGPGDAGAFFKLGNFSHHASFAFNVPAVDSAVVHRPRQTVFEWNADNKTIKLAWQKSDSLMHKAEAWLKEGVKLQEQGDTFFHQMLSYASVQFQNAKGKQCYLLVYSDLLNEDGKGAKTQAPPEIVYPFSGVTVRFLMVPFENYEEWSQLTQSWAGWFSKAQAASFQMLDIASSEMGMDIFPENGTLKKLEPFQP